MAGSIIQRALASARFRYTRWQRGNLDERWSRIRLNEAVDAHLSRLHVDHMEAIEISGQHFADRPWKSYVSTSYPDFDVCAPGELPGAFDVVLAEQVLEHVPDPFGAVRTMRYLCRPGGLVHVSTPFLVKIHDAVDYWRFTEEGMRVLLESAGLDVVEIGSWGNRSCVRGNFLTLRKRRPWHSMRNEPDFPIVVWAFATSPAVSD